MSENDDGQSINDQLILVVGLSAAGKSASLRNIKNQEDWMYLGTEAGKRLPFRNKFERHVITDPYQVFEAFDYVSNGVPDDGIPSPDNIRGMILDSLTFLMDQFESQYVLGSANTMQGWSDYAQFFKVLMQEKIAKFGKPVILTAHVKDELDEKSAEMKTFVPVKGSLKNNGIEALEISAFC